MFNFDIWSKNDFQALANLSQAGAMLVGLIALLLTLGQLSRSMRQANNSSLFYLHQYLTAAEFVEARRYFRTNPPPADYRNWSEEARRQANLVAASYDQAGILLDARAVAPADRDLFLRSSWGESICDQFDALRPFLLAPQTQTRNGYGFFRHFAALAQDAGEVLGRRRLKLVSGGQTGVDRAALDFACGHGIVYGGRCPRGGWAEDAPAPPGVLRRYPALKPTRSRNPAVRTRLNVDGADLTVVMTRDGLASPGSDLTRRHAQGRGKLEAVVNLSDEAAAVQRMHAILSHARAGGLALNIGGPRESEAPGIYRQALDVLAAAWSDEAQ